MPVTQADVIEYLKTCPGHELSDTLTRVLPGRPEAEPEGDAFEYRLVLAKVCRERVSYSLGEEWADWGIILVAPRNPDQYDDKFPGEPFCEYGECSRCKVELCSHVCGALCPICGESVHLT